MAFGKIKSRKELPLSLPKQLFWVFPAVPRQRGSCSSSCGFLCWLQLIFGCSLLWYTSDIGRNQYHDEWTLHGSSGNVMVSPCTGFSIENGHQLFQMKIEQHLPLAAPKSYLTFRSPQCQIPNMQPNFSISSVCEGFSKYFMLNSMSEKKLHPKMLILFKLLLVT